MPFKSKAQQRWMFANDPAMAKRWADHTPDIKALPERVGDSEEKKGFVMTVIPQIGKEAAEAPYVEKLASDSNVTREMVYYLSQRVGLAPIDFVKRAYANPDEYVLFLKVASNTIPPKQAVAEYHQIKRANNPGVLSWLMRFARSTPGKLTLGGTGLATAGGGAYLATRGGAQPASPPSGPASQALEQVNAAQQAAQGFLAPDPAAQGGAPAGGAPDAGGGSRMGKALPILAALGVGGLGAGYMMSRGKKKEKQSFDQSLAMRAMRRAIEDKAEEIQKNNARKILNAHLDKVASHMTLEKQAQVRTLQAELSKGKNLSEAIKVAYPQLKGEQRGILATQLVRAAVRDQYKKANLGCGPTTANVPTTEPVSTSVPIEQAGKKLRAMSS